MLSTLPVVDLTPMLLDELEPALGYPRLRERVPTNERKELIELLSRDGIAAEDPQLTALHAPQAGFGDEGFYPDIYDKTAVLVCRLAWNHPLPDGNKRAAWAALVMFIDLNDGTWSPDPPDVEDAEQAMLAIAASEVDEAWTAGWLRKRVRFEDG